MRASKSRLVPWIALGAGAYLAFAAARFPAETAYRWFAPDELRLSDVSGTAWSGSAALGSVPGLPMHDLRWNVSARALLLGRIAADVEARLAEGFVDTRVVATPSRMRFEGLTGSTRLATLHDVLALPDSVRDSRAAISVSLNELSIADGWPVTAIGELRIGDLAVPPLLPARDASLIELGSYAIEFTDSGGEGVAASIADTGGPLEVMGSLTLGLDRRYLLEGWLRVRDSAQPELVQGVGYFSDEPDAEGQRAFSFPGSL